MYLRPMPVFETLNTERAIDRNTVAKINTEIPRTAPPKSAAELEDVVNSNEFGP